MTMFRFTFLIVSTFIVSPAYPQVCLYIPCDPSYNPNLVSCRVTDTALGDGIQCNNGSWYGWDGNTKVYINGKKPAAGGDIRGLYCDLLLRKNGNGVDTVTCRR